MASALPTVPETGPAPRPPSYLPPAAAALATQTVRAAQLASSVSSSPVSSPRLLRSESSAASVSGDSLEDGEIRGEPAGPHDPVALVTVFNDPLSFNVKHPLYSTWTLWFDNASKADKAKSWDDQLQRVMEVESVEEFWGLYNNIVPPSNIQANSNYYLFKQGIKPAWEDPSNHKGGKWSVQVPREKSRDSINEWWLYTMLAAIGETFETPYTGPSGKPPSPNQNLTFTDEVTGVIVSSRKAFYRLSIWTRSSDSRAVAENIGRHFKYGVLGMPEGKKFGSASDGSGRGGIQSDCEFQSHTDSQKRKKGGWTV